MTKDKPKTHKKKKQQDTMRTQSEHRSTFSVVLDLTERPSDVPIACGHFTGQQGAVNGGEWEQRRKSYHIQ